MRTAIPGRRPPSLNAFSLMELLVVVSIIGLLAGMLLVVSNTLRESAKRSRTSAIQQIIQQSFQVTNLARNDIAGIPYAVFSQSRQP